jgi:hypothetical protein
LDCADHPDRFPLERSAALWSESLSLARSRFAEERAKAHRVNA